MVFYWWNVPKYMGKDIGEYYVDNEKKAARVNFDEIAFQRCSSENNGGTHALDRIIS